METTNPPIKTVSDANPLQQPDVAAESAIDDLISKAQESASDSRLFMEPKEPKGSRNKGGRPRKDPNDPKWAKTKKADPEAAPAPEIDPAITKEAFKKPLESVFKVTSGILVRGTGIPACGLEPVEIDALADAWAGVCVKYAPAFLESHIELITAVAVTVGVGIRVRGEIEREIERRKAEQARSVVSTQGTETVQ